MEESDSQNLGLSLDQDDIWKIQHLVSSSFIFLATEKTRNRLQVRNSQLNSRHQDTTWVFMGTTMTNLHSLLLAVLTLWRSSLVRAQSSCPTILRPSYNAPVVGSGWTAQLVVQNLSDPRGILFDSAGNLLVVEQGKGITRVSFDDRGGTCLVVNGTQTVVDDTGVRTARHPVDILE